MTVINVNFFVICYIVLYTRTTKQFEKRKRSSVKDIEQWRSHRESKLLFLLYVTCKINYL